MASFKVTLSFTPTHPAAGDTVTFTATAGNGGVAPYYYNWTFGDGPTTQYTNQSNSVQHVYSQGTYTATVVVNDSVNNTGTDSAALTVTAPLTASFSFSPTTPDAGQTVTFTAVASGGTGPNTYAWNFGDGGTSTVSTTTTTHVYAASGSYTVTLTVTDSASHTATATNPIAVAQALLASFTFSPSQPVVGQSVLFSGSGSGGHQPYSYSWTFGDGSTSTLQNPTHAYSAIGTYAVTLSVSDAVANTATSSQSITVVANLAASFTFSPAQPVVGQTISFFGSGTGGSPPYTFSWTFGDGGTSALQNPTHSYATVGTYLVVLTVGDSMGRTATSAQNVAVGAGLGVSFTYTPSDPSVGQTITFSSTPTGGVPPYTFSWTFGDGGTSTTQNPTYSYAVAGTYTVTLTVTDATSATASSSKTITVVPNLSLSFTFTPQKPVVGETVSFFSTVSGGSPPYNYTWTFGNGNRSYVPNPTNRYALAGTFTVTLTVRDSQGRSTTSSQGVTVANPLVASFTYTPLNPSIAQAITFSGSASGGTQPYLYQWDFGDGNATTGQNPSHAYSLAGAYTVTLTVTDNAGRSVPNAQQVTVSGPLTASFSYYPAKPAVNQAVTFTANVSGGSPPYTDTWNFGDGTGSFNGAALNHTYQSAGTFSVTLSVRDSASHTASAVQSVAITLGLSVDFSPSQPHPVTGENITFTSTVGGGTAPYNYSWDFGDGNTSTNATQVHAFAVATVFYVVLTVTDAAGHSGTANHSISVKAPVQASFTFSPSLPLTFEVINFTATASYGFPPYTYAWDFGDGSTGSGSRVGHGYNSAGNYTVTLTAADAAGHGVSVSQNLTVAVLLAAGITYTPDLPLVGQVVNFTGEARGANPPYTFHWTFGDATSADGQNVSHAYSQAQTFYVGLTVTDSAGRTTTVYVAVLVSSGFAASFTFSPGNPYVDQTVMLTGAGAGGLPPYSFTWSFGDGTNATGASVTHAYRASGNYTITLTVYDSSGHNATDSEVVSVTSVLVANFTFTPADPVDGESIAFNATASGGAPPYTFQWTFGDGGTSVGQNVSHTYGSPRSYRATLIVTDSVGHVVRVILTVPVGPAVKAVFAFSPGRPLLGKPIAFEANASGGAGNYTYYWDFGDGHTAEGQFVNHTYEGLSFSAVRTVTLTVCDGQNRCTSVSHGVQVDSVFSLAVAGEIAVVALILAYWVYDSRRRKRTED